MVGVAPRWWIKHGHCLQGGVSCACLMQMPPRKLRVKEPLWVLEPHEEPMNPGAYLKRYGHQLDEKERLRIEALVARDAAE